MIGVHSTGGVFRQRVLYVGISIALFTLHSVAVLLAAELYEWELYTRRSVDVS